MKLLTVDGIDIAVEKKRVRNLNLRITKKGVYCSVPMYVSYKEAEEFIRTKIPWIRSKLKEMPSDADIPECEYKTGDKVLLFGEEKRLLIVPGKKFSYDIVDDTVIMRIPADSTAEDRKNAFRLLSKELLGERIAPFMSAWGNIMGVGEIPYTVRTMKTRWGTCNVTKRRVWFSDMLAEKNDRLIEYVVVHELCHLFECNHGERFKALMTKYLPDWQERRKELNGRRAASGTSH